MFLCLAAVVTIVLNYQTLSSQRIVFLHTISKTDKNIYMMVFPLFFFYFFTFVVFLAPVTFHTLKCLLHEFTSKLLILRFVVCWDP